MALSWLEISVATGASGPVALAGEADFTSVARLDEALAAPDTRAGGAVDIDAQNGPDRLGARAGGRAQARPARAPMIAQARSLCKT